MFKSTDEFYAHIREIIERLRASGQHIWASRLETAMRSTTSGEVLGQLRSELPRPRMAGIARDRGVEALVDKAIPALDSVLGPRL